MGWCPYLKMFYAFLTSSALVKGVYFCLCLDDVEKNKYAHKPHHVIIVCRGGGGGVAGMRLRASKLARACRCGYFLYVGAMAGEGREEA